MSLIDITLDKLHERIRDISKPCIVMLYGSVCRESIAMMEHLAKEYQEFDFYMTFVNCEQISLHLYQQHMLQCVVEPIKNKEHVRQHINLYLD